jgi:hypothetical protein
MTSMEQRLRALEARLPPLEARLLPPEPAADRELLRLKVRFLAELAGQGPKESPAEAIARLLGIAPGRVLASLRSGEFFARWDELIRPLRGLNGPAFIEACEAIRARNLA